MTPFGKSVATELRSAIAPLEIVSRADYFHLLRCMRALLHNALFYVVPTPAIEAARERALDDAWRLATVLHEEEPGRRGVSLVVDQARAEAILAMQALVDTVAEAEPTVTARCLGIA